MIVAATGHRPDKLGGYGAAVADRLLLLALRYLQRERPERVISGMALGWDTAIALAARLEKIPCVAAIPFVGQQNRWPQHSRKVYEHLLREAAEVKVIAGQYGMRAFHLRNQWMVDNCDRMVALYNGDGDGGTAACVAYAVRKGRPIDNLWREWSEL